jgi:hypothetical protein
MTNAEHARATALNRIKNRLCIRCGKEPSLLGIQIGAKCRPKEATRNHIYTQGKIAKGLCRICGKRRGIFWKKSRCKTCAFRTRIAVMKLSKKESRRALHYLLHLFRGRCESCGTKRFGNKHWSIDHDHKTKKFRGVLCTRCNVALGMVGDNIKRLKNLIRYLKRYS